MEETVTAITEKDDFSGNLMAGGVSLAIALTLSTDGQFGRLFSMASNRGPGSHRVAGKTGSRRGGWIICPEGLRPVESQLAFLR